MKCVILAGGFGTRLSEETSIRPKPMVEIGGRPILWHIMQIYAAHNIKEFIICCGYKGDVIKNYFSDYFLRESDVTFDLANNQMTIHRSQVEPWKVTLVDTGNSTMTGGRIKRVQEYVGNESFCLTYGDGVGDINITEEINFHKEQGKFATLTAVQPTGRFGAFTLSADGSSITNFQEKPRGDGTWINGGFFVLEPEIFEYIDDDTTIWERGPLSKLAAQDQLAAFKHWGFWQPMDTLRDKNVLEGLWQSDSAPWKVWGTGQ